MDFVIVSIVSWNSGSFIESCLKSVLSSDFNNYLIVVFDNDSLDDSKEIINSFQSNKIKLVANNKNIGFASGHNYVINHFKADYYLILNPDASLTSNFISQSIYSFKSDNSIGSLAGLILQDNISDSIDSTGMTFTKSRRFLLNNAGECLKNISLSNTYVCGVDGAVAFYKRQAIDSILINGEFFDSEYFAYGEDWDVAWRLQIAGWKCYFNSNAIGYHKRHFKQRKISNRRNVSKVIKYHSFKNSILSILKNDDKQNFWKDCFFIFKRFIQVLGYSLIFEPYSIKAILYVIKNYKHIISKRRIVQSTRKVEPSLFRNILIN